MCLRNPIAAGVPLFTTREEICGQAYHVSRGESVGAPQAHVLEQELREFEAEGEISTPREEVLNAEGETLPRRLTVAQED